jgi:hypothetical protein
MLILPVATILLLARLGTEPGVARGTDLQPGPQPERDGRVGNEQRPCCSYRQEPSRLVGSGPMVSVRGMAAAPRSPASAGAQHPREHPSPPSSPPLQA